MGFEDICNTGLSLGLISLQTPQDHVHFDHQHKMKPSSRSDHHFFPSLTLGLSSETITHQPAPATTTAGKIPGEPAGSLYRQASSVSAVSSFSNSSVKRERDVISGEEVEVEEKVSSKMSDDQDEEGGARKKLRLTKDQSILLEESFKEHSTLNPKQKQALAKRLNLRARQVEVWFQNRRARTKLKQTEVDCELLKKCCETLTDENRRLQKEVQELKALKLTAPFYMQLSAATLTMCPSCERISAAAAAAGGENSSKTPFSIGTKPHFYSHQSAAC